MHGLSVLRDAELRHVILHGIRAGMIMYAELIEAYLERQALAACVRAVSKDGVAVGGLAEAQMDDAPFGAYVGEERSCENHEEREMERDARP